MISTVIGIPLGLWLLTAVPDTVVKTILAVVIVGFSFKLPGQRSEGLLHVGAVHVLVKPFVSLSEVSRLLWDIVGVDG
jgi:hypothetical protein